MIVMWSKNDGQVIKNDREWSQLNEGEHVLRPRQKLLEGLPRFTADKQNSLVRNDKINVYNI